jgi:erythromycin esterase-like protein
MSRMPRILCSVALLLCIQNLPAADEPAPVEWIKSHAVTLKTVEAGHGFQDMQPLKAIIGNARIVELGEATHGTREFFQLKHRMLEFLATEMGFSIFTIEANMPEAYRLNDYVLNGTGDPAALLHGMYFWTWDTQEVLDMIHWMREFNRSGKGKVQFTGFDMQTPNVAQKIVRDFVTRYDPDFQGALGKADQIAAAAMTPANQPSFGVATTMFPVKEAAGKQVRYSGWISTEGITTGYAGLWWRVDGKSGMLAFDNMQRRGVTGTTDWKRYEIELPVAADATNINFGAILTGDGSAWFSGLTVELDGQPYTGTTPYDGEMNSTRGFYLGGKGYDVQLDTSVLHDKQNSIRMKRIAPAEPIFRPASDPAPTARSASAVWSDVVKRLQTSRDAYVQSGASAKDVDWTIQNARVVSQAMQMRVNQLSRDSSMATNIKWIADTNPGAKIVVWAHNGHVGNSGGDERSGSMGRDLRGTFHDQLVIFGFAFNEGSFRAVEMGKTLHDWTVPPMESGTLDGVLAKTGIPIFALDLRHSPAWFAAPHATRSIGAMYSESSASNFMQPVSAAQTYDALLFVEKTTAAKGNPR